MVGLWSMMECSPVRLSMLSNSTLASLSVEVSMMALGHGGAAMVVDGTEQVPELVETGEQTWLVSALFVCIRSARQSEKIKSHFHIFTHPFAHSDLCQKRGNSFILNFYRCVTSLAYLIIKQKYLPHFVGHFIFSYFHNNPTEGSTRG